MEREAIAQTFYDQFHDEHVISAIQIVPGGVCKVTFESAGVKHDLCSREICNVGGVDCRVLNYAQHTTPVQIHHYPFEDDLEPLFKVLSPFGVVKRTRFQHWTNIPEMPTGTILLDVVLNHHIPSTLEVGKMRVKVWYRDQPLCCDVCKGPHRVTDCDLRGKCRRCGGEGHFARACRRPWARTGDAASRASDAADPTPAEAAGRAAVTDATSDANRAPVADADHAAGPHADGPHDAALPTSQALSEPDSLDGATFDSSACTPAVDATPSASDHRDNQLDELSSQPLLFSPAPSSSDLDSLDGATVDSGLISPAPRGTPVSSLPNVDGAAKEGSTGLLDKLKSKVGLNKKKEHKEKVINTYDSDISLSTGNTHNDKGEVISTNESDISVNNGNINNESVISNNDSSQNLLDDGQITEYIGQGILAGRSNSEMDLVVESQKHHLRTLLTVITFLCLPSLPLVLLKRNLLSLSPRANPGPFQLLNMAATAVAVARPRGVRCQLVVLPRVANILYLLVLGMSQGPLGVLVAPKALKSNVCFTNHNGGANYFLKC